MHREVLQVSMPLSCQQFQKPASRHTAIAAGSEIDDVAELEGGGKKPHLDLSVSDGVVGSAHNVASDVANAKACAELGVLCMAGIRHIQLRARCCGVQETLQPRILWHQSCPFHLVWKALCTEQ